MESKQEAREKEYQKLICELTDKFSLLSDIRDDIEEIKEKLEK